MTRKFTSQEDEASARQLLDEAAEPDASGKFERYATAAAQAYATLALVAEVRALREAYERATPGSQASPLSESYRNMGRITRT